MRKWKPYGRQYGDDVWIANTGFFPTESGSYKCSSAFTAYGTAAAGPATPGTTLNAWCGQVVDGTGVGYVGTTTKLYSIGDLSAGSFTDRSKGGGYAATTANYWCFAQFGNISIATDFIDAVQSRDATTANAFADLAGSPPKAKIVLTQSNAVLLFGYNDGVNTYLDGWWASDIGDHTTWTPASSNDAANGRILSRPGPITAAVAFRDEVIVFKKSSIFRMRYVGAPFYWTVELIANGMGADNQGAVCNVGELIIFSGTHGSYIFDGSQFRNIGSGFDVNGAHSFASSGTRTQQANYYPSQRAILFRGPSIISSPVYNIGSDAWGNYAGTLSSGSSITQDTLLVGSPDARAAMGIGGRIGGASASTAGVIFIDLSANPCVIADDTANAGAVTAFLQTGFRGSPLGMTYINRVVPMWASSGAAAGIALSAVSGAYKGRYLYNNVPYDSTAGSQTDLFNSSTGQHRFDQSLTARYFCFYIQVTYDCEIEDVVFVEKAAGTD